MKPENTALNQPLPAEVAVGGHRWLVSYRNYPVFSRPWLIGRTLLFGTAIVLWGTLSALVHLGQGFPASSAIQLFVYFVLGMTVLVSAGPTMAALARHWIADPRRERIMVILAIALGPIPAFLADAWSSNRIMGLLEQEPTQSLSSGALAINLLTLLAIYLLLGGGMALRAYLGERRRLADFEQRQAMARLEREKLHSDQQLSLLQAQIEPHFLFNTLGTVRSAIREDPDRAEATLDALSGFLRASIPRLRSADDHGQSTLQQQLDICRRYLEIMQLRMGDRLSFELDIEPAAAHVAFPPFMLLTLVENAIKHGLEPKREGGTVCMAARIDGQTLVLEVHDDGLGLAEQPGQGVGLDNIRAQLRNRFGDQARLSLAARPGGGVSASIRIPLPSTASPS